MADKEREGKKMEAENEQNKQESSAKKRNKTKREKKKRGQATVDACFLAVSAALTSVLRRVRADPHVFAQVA